MKPIIKILILPIFYVVLISCKINRVKNGEREGKWVHIDTIDNVVYRSIGRYRKGIEQKTWKQFSGKKLVRLEKYKNGLCFTQYFHDNGKVSSEGKSKMVVSEKEIHWFYTDAWKFYDENGKLIGTNIYREGDLIETIEN